VGKITSGLPYLTPILEGIFFITSFLNDYMKTMFIILICLLFILRTNAQTPAKFNFQGVARNSTGALITNTKIKLRFSILDSSAKGIALYKETRSATTDANGLFSVVIGGNGGLNITGDIVGINWGRNDKFLKVEIDPAGGNSFTNLGATQLLSVPYAEQARDADTASVAIKATSVQTIRFIGNIPFSGIDVFGGQTVTIVFSPQAFGDTNYNVSTGIYTIPSRGYYYVGFNCGVQIYSSSTAKGTITNAQETYPVYFSNPNAFAIATTYANGGVYFYNKGTQVSVKVSNTSTDGSNKFTIGAVPGRFSIYKISE
jgi:hypothetical protein